MPILHMETDVVRGVGNQLQQTADLMLEHTQQLNTTIQNLSSNWQGPSADIFISDIHPTLQQLNQLFDTGTTLNQRLQREVDEWEQVDNLNKISTDTIGDNSAPDKTEWLLKEMITNLYIIDKSSLGSEDSIIEAISQLEIFFQSVRTGGSWDYKNNELKGYSDIGISINGETYANDVPGNIMYGFMGASLEKQIEMTTLGLDAEDVLYGLAGYVQLNPDATKTDIANLLIHPDRQKLLYYSRFMDDPLDRNAIRIGIELYHQGPTQDNLNRMLAETELRRPE